LSNAYVGKWQVESITEAGRSTLVPSTVNARATFSAEGGVRLHDTVNTTGGRIEVVRGGFSIRDAGTTLVFYRGDDPVRLVAVAAFRAMAVAGRVAASVRDDRLTVTVGEFRILFTRAR
jgi:hypothetical protein